MRNHFLDMPEEVQRVVGEPPAGYYAYWAKRFPMLLMYTYGVVCDSGLCEENSFQRKFFKTNW